MSDLERWLPYRRPQSTPALRLFCFPYAGGSASAFRGWAEKLPDGVELCSVQPPGRERRMAEPAFTHMEPLVEELARVLEPVLDVPYAFFGHSMGAKVAYELARRLRRQSRALPRLMLLSGSRAPHMPSDEDPIHPLPDDELVDELHRLGGTPKEVLDNDELMRLLLPLLRADFELNETYEHQPENPFDVPVAAYGGLDDEECPPETIEGWKQFTQGPFRRRMFEGGHFFLHEVPDELLREIQRDLAGVL